MKPFFKLAQKFSLCFLVLIAPCFLHAQTSDVDEQRYLQSRAELKAKLNVLSEQLQSSDPEDRFVFAIMIPSAVGTMMDLVVFAAAAGYISQQTNSELKLRLDSIDLAVTAPIDIIKQLSAVLKVLEDTTEYSLNNEEKLKASGYSDKDLEGLVEYINGKTHQCSNKENNNSPDSFCPDYKKIFGREKFKLEKVKGGWLVKKNGKFQCCLEWDSLHCGFEIFDKKGNHQGEVGCFEDDFDPCQRNMNRGQHARPQSDHRPRTATCKN